MTTVLLVLTDNLSGFPIFGHLFNIFVGDSVLSVVDNTLVLMLFHIRSRLI